MNSYLLLFIGLLTFFFSGIANILIGVNVNFGNIDRLNKNDVSLPDVVFDVWKIRETPARVTNVIRSLCTSFALLSFVNFKNFLNVTQARVLGIFFIVLAIAYVVRLLTIASTLFPHPPHKENNYGRDHCVNNNKIHWNIFKMLKYETVIKFDTCHDYNVSGHALASVSFALLAISFAPESTFNAICAACAFIFAIMELPLIVTSRIHYTSDVILGSVLGLFVVQTVYLLN